MSAPGWVKIHRSIIGHWCSSDPDALAVWVRLICEANFEDKKTSVGGRLIDVKRGQLVFGLNAFSERSGVSVKVLRRVISQLEMDGMLGKQNFNKFSLITITCYDDYQDEGKQRAGKGQAEGRQRATPKEVKNLRSKETDSTSSGDDQQKPARETFTMMASRYMELIPEMPSVAMDAQANGRMTKAVNFYKRFKFTPERWDAYLMAIRQCDWMMSDRPRGDGTVWKRKNFDFLITEKCYLAVREGRYTASAT